MSDHNGGITTTTTPTPTTPTTPTTAAINNTIKALCCAQCEIPIATATDLLRHQIPRLESASYPYKLDLLLDDEPPQEQQEPQIDSAIDNSSSSNTNNSGEITPPPAPPNDAEDDDDDTDGDCWVYSATNPAQERYDVARFGSNAIQRVHIHGEPTVEHTFFPPHPWRMASCKRCRAHLGWSFDGVVESGGDDDGEGDGDDGDGAASSFLGLVLTNLRERRVDEASLAAAANDLPPVDDTETRRRNFRDRMVSANEMDQMMELMGGAVSVEEIMIAMGRAISVRAVPGSGSTSAVLIEMRPDPVEGEQIGDEGLAVEEDVVVGGEEEEVVEEGGSSSPPPSPPPPPVV